MTYEPAAEGSDRYPLPGTGIYEAVEGCRDLAQRAVSAVGGEERLFLLSAQETGQNSWEIRFGYSLNGIQVRLGEDGWAARFTVEQGRITGFQLRTPALYGRRDHYCGAAGAAAMAGHGGQGS